MKTPKILATVVLAFGLIVCLPKIGKASPMGTGFTYQGRLIDANNAADGLYDFQFKLYDANVAGTQKGSTLDISELDVIDGYFTADLDFGSVFDGNACWLEIGVRPGYQNDPNVYTTLSPRQEITPTPYALHTYGLSLIADNTFVGKNAGASNTTGYDNTFSGRMAGYSNKTGNGNTFSGYMAGFYNTTGCWNTFSGYKAGFSNTTGNYNTFSGLLAGCYNTEGGGNTFSGFHAGHFNTTGGWNTFSGYCAGYSNTTGNYNTFSGLEAGRSNTTGSGNTSLGDVAGYSNSTGSGNVFIGYGAGYYETGSNKLYIANSSGTPLIYGDFSTGNVGIGTTSPAYKLDVSGDIRASGSIYGNVDNSHKVDGYHVSDLDGRYVNEGQSNSITSAMIQDSTIQFADLGQNGAASGQVVKWNGSAWVADADLTGGGGLSLPYAGTVSSSGNAFSVTNTGSGTGVEGQHSGSGNYGYLGGSNYAVYAYSPLSYGYGVYSLVTDNYGRAVYGYANNGGDGANYGGYFWARGAQGYGILAKATNSGDVTNYGGYFIAFGTYGRGIYAETQGAQGYAAEFKGNVLIRSRTSGTTVMELGEGLDYAEGFNVSDSNKIEPGSILIIDTDNPGKLALSTKSYDCKVAGIVAGAKSQGSGVRLGAGAFDYDVALAGRVYCNVDATEAAVEPGDLLTTSTTPGYAMKAIDYMRAQGAILGKAMERLEKGKKEQILVLVTLQ